MSLVLRFRALAREVRRISFFSSALVACALAQPARASGPVESFVQVLLDPSNPQRMVLRYSNTSSRTGLVYSVDGGETFGLLCTAALAEAALSQPGAPAGSEASELSRSATRPLSLAVTGSGTTLLASTKGAYADDGSACAWALVDELLGAWVDSVAAHPSEPQLAFALTNGRGQGDNEGLWRRNQDGSAERLSTMPGTADGYDDTGYRGLLVAPHGGGIRFYTTASHSRLLQSAFELRQEVLVSDDGASFSAHVLPEVSEAAFSLLAVDPTDAKRVVAVWTRNDDQNRWDHERDTIVVSQDGGATFTDYLEVTEVGAVLFSADGTLWIGDAGKTTSGELPMGLYRGAPGLQSEPERLTDDQPVTCLGQRPGESSLYVCRRYEFGRFDPEGKSFTRLVDTLGVQEIMACDGRDVPRLCREQLCESGWCGPGHFAKAPLCAVYDEPYCGNHVWIEDEPDAGAPDAGAVPKPAPDAGTPIPEADAGVERSKSSSGCSARKETASSSWGAAWALLLGGIALRRRARRHALATRR